jgi:hypothetical protein
MSGCSAHDSKRELRSCRGTTSNPGEQVPVRPGPDQQGSLDEPVPVTGRRVASPELEARR